MDSTTTFADLSPLVVRHLAKAVLGYDTDAVCQLMGLGSNGPMDSMGTFRQVSRAFADESAYLVTAARMPEEGTEGTEDGARSADMCGKVLKRFFNATRLYMTGCGLGDADVMDAMSSADASDLERIEQLHMMSNKLEAPLGIGAMCNLRTLALNYNTNMTGSGADFAGMCHALSKLETLHLSHCNMQETGALAALAVTLKELHLSGNRNLVDIGGLAALSALTSLYLNDCERLEDLSPLAQLSSLERLDMESCSDVQDITPLACLTSLKHLNIGSNPHLLDIDPLASLGASLEELDLEDMGSLECIGAFEALSNLRKLDLGESMAIQDFSPLAKLTSLTCLGMRKCMLSCRIEDATAVAEAVPYIVQLTKLESLDLSFNDLGFLLFEMEQFSTLKALNRLNMSGNAWFTELPPAIRTSLETLQALVPTAEIDVE